MPREYSIEICNKLAEKFSDMGLHRPMRVGHYDAGTHLQYDIRGFEADSLSHVSLVIEKFVGGGFAGQVYQVRVLSVESESTPVAGIEVGGLYAVKILIPPSGFSKLFRNMLYWIGFQGPFQLQVNPAAARAGALWQKFIRRAAEIRFGDARTVVDIYGTFVDETLGSCGELSEWVEGRTWHLEVDERLDLLKRWRRGKRVDENLLGSAEYRQKKQFMADFVSLLHDMGAHEFARQYEWSTCKSQPNCLKRIDGPDGADGSEGLLTAVDFRAGLALLPFLPMSPGDFKLILGGLARGSLVQFDRGSLSDLDKFIASNGDRFIDMRDQLAELKANEEVYRNSVPDITHNHVRLLFSLKLWRTMLDSAVTGWKVRGLLDDSREKWLRHCKASTILFFLTGLIPILGRVLRKTWGRADWRKHYASILTSPRYLFKALKGRAIEKVITWHRKGRVSAKSAAVMAGSTARYLLHLPMSILPPGLDRFICDRQFRKEKLAFIFVRPFRLYFSRTMREQWMRDMVAEGRKKHILSENDAQTILSQLHEPYIQRYLVSLVVHLMTLPVTQMVSILVAYIFLRTHPEMSPLERGAAAGGILILFQIVPLSPGSLCRGLYTTGIAIYDRSAKDYNIALCLSYFKYIGYLAFPIQMTYRYPAMARFMAAHWGTGAVSIVPVFGERGALLEHWVFSLFYNWPLTLRRRMARRSQYRSRFPARYWHVSVFAAIFAGVLAWVDYTYAGRTGQLPSIVAAKGPDVALGSLWWPLLLLPVINGAWVTLAAGGTTRGRRIVSAVFGGVLMGLLYMLGSVAIARYCDYSFNHVAAEAFLRVFIFTVLSAIGALLTELALGEPGGN